MSQRITQRLLGAAFLLLLAACGGGSTEVRVSTASSDQWAWVLPLSFNVPRVPPSNAMSADKVALGRFLFYDRRLSGNGAQACAGCHVQRLAFTDGKPTAVGSTGESHPRNAQGLANVAYNATLTWANAALTDLETQMAAPLFGTRPIEMGVNDANREQVLDRLRGDSAYPALFAAAFAGENNPIAWPNVIRAISAFQRTLISGNSRYDRFLRGQDTLNEAETRGLNLFFGEKAECFHCHGSFNFNDQVVHASTRLVESPFHNTGLFNIDGNGGFPAPNRGLFESTGLAADMGRFRAPSLRNVEVTAPYMHDGSMASLDAVLAFYAAGGRNIDSGPNAGDGRLNPNKSALVARINLSTQDQADIVAFLKTLTDHEFLNNPKLSDPFAAAGGAAVESSK